MVGFLGHLQPGLLFLGFGLSIFCVDPLFKRRRLFPNWRFGPAVFVGSLAGAFLDAHFDDIWHGRPWSFFDAPIHRVHHVMMFTGYGLVGLADMIEDRLPGCLPPGTSAGTLAMACAMEGFLFAGHYDSAGPFEDRMHVFIVALTFLNTITAALACLQGKTWHFVASTYLICMRGGVFIINGFWYVWYPDLKRYQNPHYTHTAIMRVHMHNGLAAVLLAVLFVLRTSCARRSTSHHESRWEAARKDQAEGLEGEPLQEPTALGKFSGELDLDNL